MRPWRSRPERDDPELGADPERNNDFQYGDDPRGFKCPVGAHARRANPRDSLDNEGSVDVRLHRMIRRGTSYGPMLPEGVLEDDGDDRGIIFVFAGAHLKRQFEFVKTQWLNDGIFIGAPLRRTRWSDRRRDRAASRSRSGRSAAGCRDLPPFVVTRGGEYCFAPGLRATALARRARHVTRRRRGNDPTGTDRWEALDFGPPAPGEAEPEQPVLVDYAPTGASP